MCIKHYSVKVVYLLTQSEWVVCSQYQKYCTTKIPVYQIQKHGIADKPGKYCVVHDMEVMTSNCKGTNFDNIEKRSKWHKPSIKHIYLLKENS